MGPEPSESPSSQRDFIDGRPVTWSLLPSSFKPAALPPAEEAWRGHKSHPEGRPLHGEEEDQKMGGLDGGGPGAERRRGTGRMRKLSTFPHPKAGAGGVLEGSAASQVTGGDVVGWADTALFLAGVAAPQALPKLHRQVSRSSCLSLLPQPPVPRLSRGPAHLAFLGPPPHSGCYLGSRPPSRDQLCPPGGMFFSEHTQFLKITPGVICIFFKN